MRVSRLLYIALILQSCAAARASAQTLPPLRPPAVPLVAHDPYFSIWSPADKLTDAATVHWTGHKHRLVSLIRIGQKCYRLMGDEPKSVPPMEQTALEVTPTRSVYRFHCAEADVKMEFLTPALPDNLEVLSRPLTYVTWEISSPDNKPRQASIYIAATGELAVHSPDQKVVWGAANGKRYTALRIGSEDQPVLERAGDDTRIDWGYAYLAAPGIASSSIDMLSNSLRAFSSTGRLPFHRDGPRGAVAVGTDPPTMALVLPVKYGREIGERYAMIAYDDIWSMNYFGQRLRGYWRQHGHDAAWLLGAAVADYEQLRLSTAAFDVEFMADLKRAGGEKYARLCTLAYRQCLAANKLCADAKGMPMLFPKENTSNGCVATVDVIYPMDPLFLLISPMLAKASLAPVLNYTASPLWKFRYAPHDLGTYPHATRQVYAGDDPNDTAHEGDRMPVEESGNMILLLAGIAKEEGNAEFASRYWPAITKWAKYLEEKGFDPENQLCTDDFTGHLAHNANLSAKAIEALAAYGMLCRMRGDSQAAAHYAGLAKQMAAQWVKAADDGDHFRIAFDRAGTWSQKYNLVWDKLLGLNVFPQAAIDKEMAFYLRSRDRFGLALDNRKPYAKLDWSIWTATMAPTPRQFRELADPVYDFVTQTPERNPITDLYWTKRGTEVGMHARPVVGGVFIKMLAEPALWKKWASRAPNSRAAWAPLPTPPKVTTVVPTAEKEAISWQYTEATPPADWFKPGFAASTWQSAPGPFGTRGTPGIAPRTTWRTGDIWMRREFDMPAGKRAHLALSVYHDEDVEAYINGVLAGRASGFTTSYAQIPLRPAALAALKPGKNLIAVHCHQTGGGQGIDVGIVEVEEQ